MSLFNKLFGAKIKKPNLAADAMPTRGLNLQFAPTPENGKKFANQFADAVESNEGFKLDYSVNSIDYVDQFLQRFSDEGLSVNDFAETIFVAGTYVGQVMIENNNGAWISQNEVNLPEGVKMMPIVVKLPNGNIVDPIAKAFKRFHNGESDQIKYFYSIFTREINK